MPSLAASKAAIAWSRRGWGWASRPMRPAQFTTFDLPAYAEQAARPGANTFALAYSAKSVTASRSEARCCAPTSPWPCRTRILTLRGRAAWAHDFNTDRSIGATFQTLPGASFVVNGAAQAHDAALVTASAEMKWVNGWSARRHVRGRVLQRHHAATPARALPGTIGSATARRSTQFPPECW